MHKKKYKVTLNNWEHGILRVFEHLFDDLKEAIKFLTGSNCNSGKIHDHEGHMIHHHRGVHHHHDSPY